MALPSGPHRGKLLSCAQSLQPAAFRIVITRFLNKQINVVTMQLLPRSPV